MFKVLPSCKTCTCVPVMVFQTEKGTWSEILEDDKQRMDAMQAAAVERLVERFGDEPDCGTDSLDGATTFFYPSRDCCVEGECKLVWLA